MKKILSVFLVIVMALITFTACTDGNTNQNGNKGENGSVENNGSNGNKGNDGEDGNGATVNPPESANSDILIAYFSCTNTTEGIAKHIEKKTEGTLYKITPEVPYTADDLKYYTNCRADREQADINARPEISGSVENMEKYGIVFIGYPICCL